MKRHDWILDVLADLKAFAQQADLPVLAEQLDDTALVALAEIASLQERAQQRLAHGQNEPTGKHSGDSGAGG